ncbi:alpha/beta hydrolase [Acuticoccus sp. M5D2P5]|uniref:alpha/beta hydrolase n=1 Tax=Acuticoccus kalidii TaxID=2910977 RepID=UPI001F1D7644|nr:alpha/beta hydrolase [Acuticoccus kalidii]MCF3933590.1 alpha/beta hydrolase [Acuticoccus kalidii]
MTYPETEAFWNSQLQNSITVPDFASWEGRYRDLSAKAMATLDPPIRIATGPDPMQAVSKSETGRASDALIFIHGGYWRRFEAADFGFVAETAIGAHATFYNVDYRLMPAVRMADIVADTMAACEAILAEVDRAVIVGHSAGAHLAVEMALRLPKPPAAVVAISGIYDLAPLRHAFIQDELHLTTDEVREFSPLSRAADIPCPVYIAAGGDETVEFRRQSAMLFDTMSDAGRTASLRFVAFRHHSSIVSDLAIKESGWSIVVNDAMHRFRA